MKFLQETGLIRGPRELKFDAEVSEFWNAVNKAFDEHDIPGAARVAINATLVSAPGAERSLPPAHWMRNTHELEAAVQRNAMPRSERGRRPSCFGRARNVEKRNGDRKS
jgi:hypothetical protein